MRWLLRITCAVVWLCALGAFFAAIWSSQYRDQLYVTGCLLMCVGFALGGAVAWDGGR